MSLTDTIIKNAKPKEKSYKLSDGKGMYLLVKKSGKYFQFDYRYGGKRKTLSLGVYPETSLKKARERLDDARLRLQEGINPVEARKAKKMDLISEVNNSFRSVAWEWFNKHKGKWSETHAKRKWRSLEKDIFPALGNVPIKNITARDLLQVLEKIQKRNAIETSHRAKSICGEVFRYGIVTDKCDRDVSLDLRGL